ncbi:serine hydrolase domain-containing protein [Herbihabitans rhizosphaerae]|nr:serine hydrolase domain-containing protein [Herbihabitans rhizosphaerae]
MREWRMRAWLALAGCVVALAVFSPGSTGATPLSEPLTPPVAERHTGVQVALDAMRLGNDAVGASVTGSDSTGIWHLSSGSGRAGTDTPIRSTDQIKVASNTKTFVASVVLQLVGERRIDLDAPVGRYLPGVVSGNGHDGDKITVRQLLQHTSGLPDYLTPEIIADPLAYTRVFNPRDIVAMGLLKPPAFKPGAGWLYSNTNYVLAGMIIEKVTGRYVGDEILDRIVRPLELSRTTYPKPGQRTIGGPHVRGYMDDRDTTETEPSLIGAAGEMVSTGVDMTKFAKALASGRVVPPRLLAEMRRTVDANGVGYGLGVFKMPLTCGGEAWGHGGAWPAYTTLTMATDDGREVFVSVNRHNLRIQLNETADAALCSGRSPR